MGRNRRLGSDGKTVTQRLGASEFLTRRMISERWGTCLDPFSGRVPASPHPGPLPWREGGLPATLRQTEAFRHLQRRAAGHPLLWGEGATTAGGGEPERLRLHSRCRRFTLSPRERAGVRGNGAYVVFTGSGCLNLLPQPRDGFPNLQPGPQAQPSRAVLSFKLGGAAAQTAWAAPSQCPASIQLLHTFPLPLGDLQFATCHLPSAVCQLVAHSPSPNPTPGS